MKNGPSLFHDALHYVMRGEKRFHVANKRGEDFDLIYEDNDQMAKSDPSFPKSDFFFAEVFFPPYYFYDENQTDKINLEMLEGSDEIFFEEANEYSIVIAGLVLKHTKMQVTFKDKRISLFPWIRKKVSCRKRPHKKDALYVQKDFYPIYETRSRYCTTGLFHSLFLLQWISDLPKEKIRYLSLTIRKTEGIGSIIATYSRVAQAFGKQGITVFIEPGSTRFSSEMLENYFVFGSAPKDSNEENTAYAKCFNSFVLNNFIQYYEAKTGPDILQPVFLNQMKEYADEIISDQKILGVLLRGTDYSIANFKGAFHPAPLEECMRIIDERLTEHNYDKIFVATEDSYYLERMIMKYPGRILAVSQERHDVSEFRNIRYISELEKDLYQGDAYYASVVDTTVNYFYAIYMLSRCESLISNCMCSGVSIAQDFNQGRYARTEIVSMMLMEKEQKVQ